ncbi:MAG: hypothetical protein ACPLZD_03890 [Candidatus Saccharicenans sp.]|nr:MAG: hypothetical protein C0168_11450 [Candidatus Aminicenantes bacterium]HEK86649.1 hypothetical protein [Candidatus Aminicenantes bacterium]
MERMAEKESYLSPVSKKLVEMIEKDAKNLASAYLQEVKKHPNLPTYHSLPEKEVYERAYQVYSQLERWISYELESEKMREHWIELGRQRRLEGFSLPEIFLSLCLERKQLWNKIQAEGLLDNALDLYQALELYNRIVTFFDRALYYAIIGYYS